MEVLDGNRAAADPGDHGADHPGSPVPMRPWWRHQDDQDGGEQSAARGPCPYVKPHLFRRVLPFSVRRRWFFLPKARPATDL